MTHKKIIMGADPSGYDLKNSVKKYLQDKGYIIEDITQAGAIEYYSVGDRIGERISQEPSLTGIIFCGTGMGVSIIANKHQNVYCGVCESVTSARFCKVINNCNILAMGGLLITPFKAKMMADAFLTAEFSKGFSEATPENLKSALEKIEDIECAIYRK